MDIPPSIFYFFFSCTLGHRWCWSLAQLSSGEGGHVHLIDWLHGLCPGERSKSKNISRERSIFMSECCGAQRVSSPLCACAVYSHLLAS